MESCRARGGGSSHLNSDEGEAEEEAEGAAHLGHEGGKRVDQLLLLHEGAVGGRPQLEEEVLAAPRQEQFLTHLDAKIRSLALMN